MDDRAIVAAMVSGDPRGLEGAYRRYADRIYTYCRGLLRDSDAAADAVHDTFIAANQHAGQLRDPDRLRAWLYAIARHECLRQLRGRARQVPLEAAGDVTEPTTDPGAGVHAAELRALVRAAADGLSPGDREVFELMVRHGLAAGDVAGVLGVSADHAHARLSRARTQLERSLGALLVARTGRTECQDLAGILHGWDGKLTALLRKRISRHVESCRVCGERRRSQMRPASLLAGYAALPFLVVPAGLWDRIRLTSGQPGGGAAASDWDPASGSDRTLRFDPRTGFPRPVGAARKGRRFAVLAAAGVVLLLGLGLSAAGPLGLGRQDPAVFNAPRGTTSPAAAPAASPTPVDQATPGEGPVTGVVPTTRQPPPEPSPSPTPSGETSPQPLSMRATSDTECTVATATLRQFTLTVSLATDGPALTTAVLRWSPPPDAIGQMAIDGTTARTSVEGLTSARVTWWVEAVAADGRRAVTSPATVPNPCP